MARIIFLGTGGDSFVIGKQQLASGGIVINTGDHQIHLDPGPGALNRAREEGINFRETLAILVSAADIAHANDINAVVDAVSLGGFDSHGVLIGHPDALTPNADTMSLRTSHQAFLEKIIPLTAGQKAGIESIEIQALETGTKSLGFKLFTASFILTYTGRIAYDKNLAVQYEQSDILIIEVPNPSGVKGELLNTDDAIKIISKAKPQLAIITGFTKRMLDADPLDEARTIQKASGVQCIAAKDGLKINPTSYAAVLRQKTLNLYKQP